MPSVWSYEKHDCDEKIGLVVSYPRHFPHGVFDPSATLKKDDLVKCSCSVVRLYFSSPNEINDQVISPQALKNPKFRLRGILVAFESEIKQEKNEEGCPIFLVIPDGIPNFRSHSVLGFDPELNITSKQKQREYRDILVSIFYPHANEQAIPDVILSCSSFCSASCSQPSELRQDRHGGII